MGKRITTAAKTLAAVAFAAGTVTVGAGSASAAPAVAGDVGTTVDCSVSHPNRDSGSGLATTDVNIRRGPSTSCAADWWAGKRTKLYYHCWASGKAVHGKTTWTHVRVAGTQRTGWVSDYYLNDGGAIKKC